MLLKSLAELTSACVLIKDVDCNRVKVVVNDGVIFLVGLVSHAEADSIVESTKKA